MSTELRGARDHARRQVVVCTSTAERLERELALVSDPDAPAPDPKGQALARQLLERNQKNAVLWDQIADEIDEHLHRQSKVRIPTGDQLLMFIDEANQMHGPDVFLEDGS